MAEKQAYDAKVRVLIRLGHDGAEGFASLGPRLQEAQHRSFYLEEATVRSAFASELERALGEEIGTQVREDGTLLGPLHRAFLELKASFGAGDRKILSSTEVCEQLALKTYREALEELELPEQLRRVVARQAEHVRRTYSLIKLFQDQTGDS